MEIIATWRVGESGEAEPVLCKHCGKELRWELEPRPFPEFWTGHWVHREHDEKECYEDQSAPIAEPEVQP